ncbi:unnamed protein product [Dovyalis caffra]|uniref:TF-B3 domain-containing protein n=1 Tax=Dovyalis caffra TaxID=77055 RepID=A0AAV1S826_9ROSI|nr:unnamed protein product [Dovyalis caffra]
MAYSLVFENHGSKVFAYYSVEFARQLKREVLDKAVLNSSEELWQIQLGKYCKGLLYFEEEWANFVKHPGLLIGDFVVFERKEDTVFEVLFDATACEKEFPPTIDLTTAAVAFTVPQEKALLKTPIISLQGSEFHSKS